MNRLCPACRCEFDEEQAEIHPSGSFKDQSNASARQQRSTASTLKGHAAPASVATQRESREPVASRRHLANLRVIQKNLVYVIGLSPKVACDENMKELESMFGVWGKIVKIVVNKRSYVGASSGHQPSSSLYVTYARKEDAARAIQGIDASTGADGRVLRASYGTTKYCTFFLRGAACQNPGCMYLHEQGDESESFTKEQMAEGFHLDRFLPKGLKTASAGHSDEAPSLPPSIRLPRLSEFFTKSAFFQLAAKREPQLGMFDPFAEADSFFGDAILLKELEVQENGVKEVEVSSNEISASQILSLVRRSLPVEDCNLPTKGFYSFLYSLPTRLVGRLGLQNGVGPFSGGFARPM